MSLSFTSLYGAVGKLVKSAAIIATLCAGTAASAATIDFESVDSPLVLDGQRTTLGDYYIDSFGENVPGALVGTMGGNDICTGFGVACPTNNSSSYYNVLADSYFVLAKSDNTKFKVQSLQASFIGIGQSSFGSPAGAIELIAFNDNNEEVGYMPLFLRGPVAGQFGFADFSLGAFANTHMTYLLVLGYACDSTDCSRTGNRANFAIDNIVTAVPEPTSVALFGLGLLGLGAARRRSA